ncbi:MAG: DUF1326 domain-containing protein [Motiliproteus sp.]
MTYVDWRITGLEFSACNCDFSCPCQFNALPTYGDCRAAMSMIITSGHFGQTKLNGLKFVLTVAWPGAIHEGTCQVFIDENSEEDQCKALLTILSGEETTPGSTIFQVFSNTLTEVLEPQFVSIELDIDLEARRARSRIAGVIEASGEPILNPITSEEHRISVKIPNGFEYAEAEYGSCKVSAEGAIPSLLRASTPTLPTWI